MAAAAMMENIFWLKLHSFTVPYRLTLRIYGSNAYMITTFVGTAFVLLWNCMQWKFSVSTNSYVTRKNLYHFSYLLSIYVNNVSEYVAEIMTNYRKRTSSETTNWQVEFSYRRSSNSTFHNFMGNTLARTIVILFYRFVMVHWWMWSVDLHCRGLYMLTLQQFCEMVCRVFKGHTRPLLSSFYVCF